MAAYTPDGHGPQQVTASYADLIASDASNVHIIRSIVIVNTSASTRTVYVSIGAGAAPPRSSRSRSRRTRLNRGTSG